jgi:hypothetical protein
MCVLRLRTWLLRPAGETVPQIGEEGHSCREERRRWIVELRFIYPIVCHLWTSINARISQLSESQSVISLRYLASQASSGVLAC